MPAADRFFVDTNVLLYAVDATEPLKAAAAAGWLDRLWQRGAGSVSWQVVNEFYSNLIGKFRVPPREARARVEAIVQWQPVGFSLGMLQRCWHWMDDAHLPYWDGLILAAAEKNGCTVLLSEDFQPGRKFGTITVVNPFTAGPDDFGLSGD